MSHKFFKFLLPLITVIFLPLSQSQAAITINISAEKLKDPGGFDMAVEGVLVLVADANRNGFAGAGDTSFVMGDDVMVAKWDIATGGGNAPGAFSGTTGSISFSGDWDAGDPLALYWFPTLTSAEVSPGEAVPYGMFRIMSENFTLSGTMDPEQATTNADNVGNGTGTISGSYDSTTNTLNYSLTFQDLTSEITNMHFHVGAVGVSGGVDLGIPSPWVSPKEGTDIVLTDEQEANLLAGNWYVNVHTSDFGSGEIRGQVIVIEDLGGEGPNGTDAWTTPLDGTIGHNLIFLTTDATILSSDGESDPSEGEAMNTTPGTPPLAPSGTAGAADGPGKINITWTDNATDETGYRIERSISGSNAWVIIGTAAADASMFVDDTVEDNTAYEYRVLALRGPSQSDYDTSAEVTSAAASARLTNLSNRALVGTGDNILIGSFRLRGGPLRIYARVGGPALEGDVEGFLEDPTLELIRLSDQEQIGFNDSWKIDASDNSDQQAEIEATLIPPTNDVEPALIANLEQEGFYSIIVRGVNDTTGFANVEIYEYRDPGEPNPGKLTNLSNRALVGTGDNILIGSFRVRGDGSQRIYARVGGPALEGDVEGFLEDPTLELIRLSDQEQIGFNDSWKIDASDNSDQQAEIEATLIPPTNDVEPALIATLNQEGFYSIVVRGVNNTTGFANVEIYDYPE